MMKAATQQVSVPQWCSTGWRVRSCLAWAYSGGAPCKYVKTVQAMEQEVVMAD
jgi:hypothetical protein